MHGYTGTLRAHNQGMKHVARLCSEVVERSGPELAELVFWVRPGRCCLPATSFSTLSTLIS